MKRTIAEAWTKSQEKKGAGDMPDMGEMPSFKPLGKDFGKK